MLNVFKIKQKNRIPKSLHLSSYSLTKTLLSAQLVLDLSWLFQAIPVQRRLKYLTFMIPSIGSHSTTQVVTIKIDRFSHSASWVKPEPRRNVLVALQVQRDPLALVQLSRKFVELISLTVVLKWSLFIFLLVCFLKNSHNLLVLLSKIDVLLDNRRQPSY